MKHKKISVIDRIVKIGIERDYSPAEIKAIREEIYGDAIREHEELKAAGRLNEVEVPEGYEEELPEWTEDDIVEDDPETEELLANVFYGNHAD
jgi:hypothetical protein